MNEETNIRDTEGLTTILYPMIQMCVLAQHLQQQKRNTVGVINDQK